MNYLQKAIDALLNERQEVVAQLERIDTALSALGHTGIKTKASRASKPCCTKQEVITIVAGLLRDNATLSKAELEDLTKDKVANELSKSLSGFAMRFREALGDPQFAEIEPGKFRLAASITE